jgi:OOP family OmpA-OmpF porin
MLQQNKNVQVEIQGHTDNIGTAEYNQRLSEARARAVKNYLVEKGVQKERLYPVGFGYVLSRAPNDTETGRALNRRVEIALQN